MLDRCRGHAWMGRERRFDLAGLDAEAADLDLPVGPTQELDVPRRQEAGEVAGTVEAFAPAAQRVGDETLGRQLGSAEIAARQAVAGGEQLAGDTDGHRLQPAVEQAQAPSRSGSRTG